MSSSVSILWFQYLKNDQRLTLQLKWLSTTTTPNLKTQHQLFFVNLWHLNFCFVYIIILSFSFWRSWYLWCYSSAQRWVDIVMCFWVDCQHVISFYYDKDKYFFTLLLRHWLSVCFCLLVVTTSLLVMNEFDLSPNFENKKNYYEDKNTGQACSWNTW